MLVVFAGLPGAGKTTIARFVASALRAAYVRVDTIEHALKSVAAGDDVGIAGYAIAHAIAADNASRSRPVVIDCVNPVKASRDGWQALAERLRVPIYDVEIVCTDEGERARRLHERGSVIERIDYEPWDRPHIIVDSAQMRAEEAAELIVSVL